MCMGNVIFQNPPNISKYPLLYIWRRCSFDFLHFLKQLNMNFCWIFILQHLPIWPRYPFKLRNAGCIPAEGGCYIPVGPCTCVNLPLGKSDGSKGEKNTCEWLQVEWSLWRNRHSPKMLKVGSWPVKGKRRLSITWIYGACSVSWQS